MAKTKKAKKKTEPDARNDFDALYVAKIIGMIGKQYRMKRYPSISGYVVSVQFHETGCERASLEILGQKGDDLRHLGVDVTELESIETGETVEGRKPGGPELTHEATLR